MAQREAPPLSEWNPSDAELLRGLFLEEAEEHLRRIAEAHQRLSRAADPTAADGAAAVDDLFRHLHSLKGAAGSVGFGAIARAAHDLEELCAEIRTGRLAATAGILDRIDESTAGLRALLDGARAAPGRQVPPDPSGPVGERRPAPSLGPSAAPRPAGTVRVESDRLDALLDGVGDLVILRTRVERRLRELEGVLRDLHGTRASLRGALAKLSGDSPGESRDIGGALDGLGEIEVEFTDAISYLERATTALGGETESLRRTGDHLEEQVRRARLVPLDWLYGRLAAALREIERAGNRRAELVFAGGEIELDKSVMEQLGDPLLHLLRNAIAHGVEPEPERLARGKPAKGRITISTRQEGEFVFVEVEDDGAGLAREAVRDALVRGGRLAEGAALPETLLVQAIFEAGFSSRPQADALAGRGMGLDIVKKALVRLGGDVTVEYEEGRFTRFRLRLPPTAAITQALLFKVGGQVYAVSAAHVVEALPLGADDPSPFSDVPVLRLQALLGAEMPPGRRLAALRIRYGGRGFIVTCDKIIGPRTIVVRPLGPVLAPLPLYAGVTVSGAGKAQLVLDLGALAEAAHGAGRATGIGARRTQPRVLVVDDSRLSREAAARLLAGAGYHPITAEDGWEAWEMLGERRFDAVVTDLEMPRVDGFELIARIRSEPTLRGLPVVVLSSRTSQATRDRALRAGASTVLPKVPNKRGLAEALAALLGDQNGRSRAAGDSA